MMRGPTLWLYIGAVALLALVAGFVMGYLGVPRVALMLVVAVLTMAIIIPLLPRLTALARRNRR